MQRMLFTQRRGSGVMGDTNWLQLQPETSLMIKFNREYHSLEQCLHNTTIQQNNILRPHNFIYFFSRLSQHETKPNVAPRQDENIVVLVSLTETTKTVTQTIQFYLFRWFMVVVCSLIVQDHGMP